MLDIDQPGWQDNTVFLLDNATYHWSSDTQQALRIMGLQVIYSGSYSFSAAPAETLFSQLKQVDINPDNRATGKR